MNQVDRKAGVEAGQPLNASSNQNWLKTYFSQSQFKTLNIFNLLLCDSMQNKLDVQTNKKLLPFTDNIYPFCYFLSRLLPIILMNSTLQLKKVLNCLPPCSLNIITLHSSLKGEYQKNKKLVYFFPFFTIPPVVKKYFLFFWLELQQ